MKKYSELLSENVKWAEEVFEKIENKMSSVTIRSRDKIVDGCDDWLPRVDFRAHAEPVYYDSTAGAVAACGFIEMAKLLPENEGGMYMNDGYQASSRYGRKVC